jgi:multiple sugar transport system substrate-binding protein
MLGLKRPVTRRQVLAGSAAATGSVLAASCSSGSGGGSSGGKVKLQVTVWLGADELKAMNQLAAKFKSSHPKIDIQYINIVNGGPYGSTKLQQMIAGGTPPDLMMLNSGQFESLAARKALANVDDLIAKDKLDLGVYWPQVVDGCTYQGHKYALPKDMSNVLIYLNKDLFKKTGVALPSADWTWDDYRSIAKELTAKLNTGKKVTKWGTVLNNTSWNWSPFVWTDGGEVYTGKQCQMTTPKTQAGLEFFFGLRVKDKAAPAPGALASFGSQSAENDAFIGGVIGFGIYGPWLRPGLVTTKKFDWTIRPLPHGPQGQAPVIPVYTDMWAMSASTKNKDAAWTLMKWFSGEEGQQAWLDIYGGRSISPVKKLALGDEWLSYGGAEHRADNQMIISQLEPKQNRRPPEAFANGTEASTLWDNEFKVVMTGSESIPKATKKICGQLSSILQRTP